MNSLEYPIDQLAVLRDPRTYFALWPADISTYVLRPYLITSVAHEPIEATWRTPRWVAAYQAAGSTILDFCLLTNGDILALMSTGNGYSCYLYRINPLDSTTRLRVSDELNPVTTMNYDAATDTLTLPFQREEPYGKGGRSYARQVPAFLTIPLISTIQTPEQFHEAFVVKPDSPFLPDNQIIGRHTIKYWPLSLIDFYFDQGLVMSWKVDDGYLRARYFGGYLLVLRYNRDKIDMYRCLGE